MEPVGNAFELILLINGPGVRVPGGPPLEMTGVCKILQTLFSRPKNEALQRICKEYSQTLVTKGFLLFNFAESVFV
jgi:hypothetical protein